MLADRDRPDAYDAVADQRWDAVIDVARQPGHVRRAVTALQPVTWRFVYVSSGNVYASQRELGQDEDAPLLAPLASDVMESMEHYGEAKAACEQAVLSGFGADRVIVARVGLIGGPGMSSDARATGRGASPTPPTRRVRCCAGRSAGADRGDRRP